MDRTTVYANRAYNVQVRTGSFLRFYLGSRGTEDLYLYICPSKNRCKTHAIQTNSNLMCDNKYGKQ